MATTSASIKPAIADRPVDVAIIGSGNIGTDLMLKVLGRSRRLRLAAMAGIDPASDGLARARARGVATTAEGIEGMLRLPGIEQVRIVFDATSAGAHLRHDELLRGQDLTLIDLTPAAVGPYVVPPVNAGEYGNARNINMVTCGGQATIPIVAAVNRVTPVLYAEIVASISSRSAGPGTRGNIDEFTRTTARAIETVGGARQGKAIIVLNPSEPPLIMRDTVYCLTHATDTTRIARAVDEMVAAVQDYVPGYRLKQPLQFERITACDVPVPGLAAGEEGLKVSVFLEVEGAADYLPRYAGNLDIMTAAALYTAEQVASHRYGASAP